MVKIAACMIVKNEEEVIERILSTLTEGLDASVISHVCIVDTGSTDRTIEIVREKCKEWKNLSLHEIEWKDSFAEARNKAIELTPDADLVYMPDADDVIGFDWQELHQKIDEAYRLGRRVFGYPYVLGVNDKCESLLTITRQSLFDPKQYQYVGRAHECIDGIFGELYGYLPSMKVTHSPIKKELPDNKKRRYYADLLKMQVEETGDQPRWLFYYGRELAIIGNHADAVDILERYINVSSFLQEKTDARIYRALSFFSLGRNTEAEGEIFRAWIDDPMNREPLMVIADRLYSDRQWVALTTVCETLMNIPYNALTRYGQRRDTSTWKIYDYLCIGYFYLGDKEKSLMYGRHALEYKPSDQRLISNVRMCEQAFGIA